MTRAEEEAIQQAMQDATLKEQAQADRERIQQVPALLPFFSADSLSLLTSFCALSLHSSVCVSLHVCLCAHLHVSLTDTQLAWRVCAARLVMCCTHDPFCFLDLFASAPYSVQYMCSPAVFYS